MKAQALTPISTRCCSRTRSGTACAKALEAEGFRVTRVDVDRNVAATLAALKPDVAFNALHGPYGEDGTIQGPTLPE